MARTVQSSLPDRRLPDLGDRYRVQRAIASGGMSSVWCAEDQTLKRLVAIKLLAEPIAADDAARRRFSREARAAARAAAHPHVAKIFDIGHAPDRDGRERAFIVMEYLSGGTVADALAAGEVSKQDALRWLREAAAALDYAHSQGVVHRDVKPANLLLDRDGSLHVADFGIAQLTSEDTITAAGYLLGTAAYISPERAGGGEATAASDRYSLAVVAFELLTGSRPFTAEHFAAQARAHMDLTPPSAHELNPNLPVAIDSVLARGLAKRPEERFGTATELAEHIDGALRDPGPPTAPMAVAPTAPIAVAAGAPAPVRARPAALALNPVRARGRVRRLPAAVALVAVGACVILVAIASGGGSQHRRVAAQHPRPSHSRTSASASTTTAKTTAQTSSAADATTPSATPVASSATGLESQGHALMLAGSYAQAVPILRQAVATANPSTLTYAYALFDLGHSLRMAGDPGAAIPILRRRLQIPNQTAVVQAELQAALNQAGQGSGAAAPAPSGDGAKPGAGDKGHGHGAGPKGAGGGN